MDTGAATCNFMMRPAHFSPGRDPGTRHAPEDAGSPASPYEKTGRLCHAEEKHARVPPVRFFFFFCKPSVLCQVQGGPYDAVGIDAVVAVDIVQGTRLSET